MFYTVGEAAKILNVAPSAIRYYDREGLLPFVERTDSGIRRFQERDFEWLRVIGCLKSSGMHIKNIKRFIDMAVKGDETIPERLKMMKEQRNAIMEQLEELQKTLDILDYKCWYYETAEKAGTTSVLKDMSADEIPELLRKARETLSSVHNRH